MTNEPDVQVDAAMDPRTVSVHSNEELNMPSRSRTAMRRVSLAVTSGVVGLIAGLAFRPGLAQTAPAQGTTSIRHDAESARALQEPSFQTREERLAAKPLDWNATIGTPKPHALTAQERRTLANAKRGASSAGAPNPKAEEEARKMHPADWE